MTRSKRPKLGEVLRGSEPATPATPHPQQGRGEEPFSPGTEAPAEKMVQLNVTVPPALRRAVRIRALQRGVEVSAVVRELLQEWLSRGDAPT